MISSYVSWEFAQWPWQFDAICSGRPKAAERLEAAKAFAEQDGDQLQQLKCCCSAEVKWTIEIV